MKGKVTEKNVEEVTKELLHYITKDIDEADDRMVNYLVDHLMDFVKAKKHTKAFCKNLDAFLDELCSDDYFGTESQCDPRGDQRN
jgi:hypothetical protein